ncbi:MAG: glycoside hydrolase family 127 protein [Clostridia bacterium]|nr:glycoside hydrolase family 127 protein [Clostridia bacterium]
MQHRTVNFSQTRITGGFWKQKQALVRRVTTKAVYDRFADTGRIDAFRFDWKEGMPNKPHFFWDSDVAKWIEGAAYQLAVKPDERLEKKIDALVDLIAQNQGEDGYFNIFFTVVQPENRFTNRDWHELYCAGHLMEAAVAYYEATGKDKFLSSMCKYADYIEKRFVIDADTPFMTPGHEEIELALVRLYECTGEVRYLNLAKHFVDTRGHDKINIPDWMDPSYSQSHVPVRKQKTAEGHAVRAMYLYCGMADVAHYTNDCELQAACEALFDNVANRRMYITGGIGSSGAGEAFTVDYDLPNLISYTESCAALALALFANRMLRFGADSKYSDVVERVIYNGFLSSLSLDGKSFFYQNPLEIMPRMHKRDVSVHHRSVNLPPMQRSEVFACSCCPPNIVRFIPSIANMLYSDDGEVIYVHQFMQSVTTIEREGKMLVLEQQTKYPENGKVKIKLTGGDARLAVRIPGWFDGYKGETEKGYAYFDVKDGEELTFDFTMKPVFIEAHPEVVFASGRCAVMRGPVLYCMEGKDNGELLRDITLDSRARFQYGKHPELGVPQLTVRAYRTVRDENAPLYRRKTQNKEKTEAVLIPYYAFANRGESEMQVWHYVK